MIHLDYADGTSAWLTDEQLKEKHPELYAKLRQPAPYAELGQKLRNIRIQNNLTVREMAQRLNCTMSYLCDVERGRVEATAEMAWEYHSLTDEQSVE